MEPRFAAPTVCDHRPPRRWIGTAGGLDLEGGLKEGGWACDLR